MSQTDFLQEYVVALLDESGLAKEITPEQIATYTSELVSIVEERIGLEFVPKLSTADFNTFTSLINKGTATSGEWQQFWQKAIPTFTTDLKAILQQFAEDFKNVLFHRAD